MGAIFISDKNKVHDVKPALALFDEMGFSSPTLFENDKWAIYAYSKMIGNSNYVTGNGCTLISTGTPVYRGLNYKDSLAALLQDYLSDCIDFERLIGQYAILFIHGDAIEILCDPLGCKHLFTDINHGIISSHMLPISQCLDTDLHVCREAIYEKFMTGIIMPPRTIFREILQIERKTAESITCENTGIRFIETAKFQPSGAEAKSFDKCLEEQTQNLCEYFELLKESGRDGTDIGLSGGYDSRLVLACLFRFNKGRIHLHSHATENDHRKELSIAEQMAEYVGVPCHSVATKKLKHCENVDEILRKSVLYFDGRSSFSIGGCGEVYTALYRKESTECTPFTLTGVGGELFRNIFDIGFGHIRFDRFMEHKLFSQSFRKAIPENIYYKTRDDIIQRTMQRLQIDQKVRQPRSIAHRYYCEIMMPDGQGAALDAYNQVSCCVAPFLEPRIIAKGYEAIPFHCSGGEFEGKLINHIDPGLAAITSTYGYPIGERPLRAKVKERLRTLVPYSVWDRLANVLNKQIKSFSIETAMDTLCVNSKTMKEAYTFLTELFPEISFADLLHSNEDIRKIQFVAMTLYQFRERIKVN